MPGPPKQYPIRLEHRLDAETLAKLDKLRGNLSRSEAIRGMIHSFALLERTARAALKAGEVSWPWPQGKGFDDDLS